MIPDISIVIIGRDVRPELARCLASIEDHAALPAEVIYVDNASRDDSVAWVRGEHPDVQVIELDRNEFDTARNYGLERASAPLTMFLDSDAALTEDAVPTLVEAIRSDPGVVMVAPRLVYDDGSLQLSCRRYPPLLLPLLRRPPLDRWFEQSRSVQRYLMADADLSRTRPVLYVIGACQLFRTDVAQTLGGMDASMRWGWSDVDWCLRMRDAGGEILYVPDAEVFHSYRRLSKQRPASRDALRALGSFAGMQWKFRYRRAELIRLSRELDRVAAG